MVALKRQREPRHYSIGPLSEDRPLKLYEPPAQVPKQIPWAVELAMAVGGLGIIGLLVFASAVKWWMQ